MRLTLCCELQGKIHFPTVQVRIATYLEDVHTKKHVFVNNELQLGKSWLERTNWSSDGAEGKISS